VTNFSKYEANNARNKSNNCYISCYYVPSINDSQGISTQGKDTSKVLIYYHNKRKQNTPSEYAEHIIDAGRLLIHMSILPYFFIFCKKLHSFYKKMILFIFLESLAFVCGVWKKKIILAFKQNMHIIFWIIF
jgi:hypothetical protein